MDGACNAYGGSRETYTEKPEGKKPLGKHSRRWGDNIKMDLQEVVCGYMDWIELAQDGERWWGLVNAIMKLGLPKVRVIP
jgi:hypothetical protein